MTTKKAEDYYKVGYDFQMVKSDQENAFKNY
jgi:hypothetical protein